MTTTARAAGVLVLALGLVGGSSSGAGGSQDPVGPPAAPPSSSAAESRAPESPAAEETTAPSPSPSVSRIVDLGAELAALEEEFDATVGVSALDTATVLDDAANASAGPAPGPWPTRPNGADRSPQASSHSSASASLRRTASPPTRSSSPRGPTTTSSIRAREIPV